MAFKKTPIVSIETKKIVPTAEQVVNMELVRSGKDVKIVAGAGTGKSSSLRYIASSIPEKNFLVLCFNSANAEESNKHPGRPENIFYSTIHSLAYREVVDAKFRKKLGGYLDYRDLPEGIEACLPAVPEKELYKHTVTLQKAVLECITYFCRSDAGTILTFAFNRYKYQFIFTDKPNLLSELELSEYQVEELAFLTDNYWNMLISKEHSATVTHDVYLKMYQLAGHPVKEVWDKQAKAYFDIDVVCLDEAQDTNPVSEAVFATQIHLQRVLVGDPMQQLYAWRGAGKAMDGFTDFAVGSLTESFRFNQTIADKANLILRKAGSAMQLKGSGRKTSIDTRAHLCRTNASVIALMLNHIGSSTKIYTSIDLKSTFGKLYHMQSCFFNEKPMYPSKELSAIVDKKSLLLAMEYSEELRRLDKLRQHLTAFGSLTVVKKDLEKLIVDVPSEADLVITTIHAAKGMEYDHVTINDDFLTIPDGVSVGQVINTFWETDSLQCLLYVGVTRAKVKVRLPDYFSFI